MILYAVDVGMLMLYLNLKELMTSLIGVNGFDSLYIL